MITTDVEVLSNGLVALRTAEFFVMEMERCLLDGCVRNSTLFPIGKYMGIPVVFPKWSATHCMYFIENVLADARREVRQRRAELDLLMADFKKI